MVGLRGKVLLTSIPVETGRETDWRRNGPPPGKKVLRVYDFAKQEYTVRYSGVTDFTVDAKRQVMQSQVAAP